LVVFLMVFIWAVTVFGVGLVLGLKQDRWDLVGAGCVCVTVVFAALAIAHLVQVRAQQAEQRSEQALAPVMERLEAFSVMLNLIAEQQKLSERAKAIAFRADDREALRRAIREEIARKDYEAALVLAEEMERGFGYREEAERFREEIRQFRMGEVRHRLDEATATIDRMCRAEQWSQALAEADKMARMYPTEPHALGLAAAVEARRQEHKARLLDAWAAAVQRHDVDGSIEILKQLDMYLTPAEAESMKEQARQVFKDKLALMAEQFKAAVHAKDWAEAIRLGETIARDFPNSKMAEEVRGSMDQLRQRAQADEGAAVRT